MKRFSALAVVTVTQCAAECSASSTLASSSSPTKPTLTATHPAGQRGPAGHQRGVIGQRQRHHHVRHGQGRLRKYHIGRSDVCRNRLGVSTRHDGRRRTHSQRRSHPCLPGCRRRKCVVDDVSDWLRIVGSRQHGARSGRRSGHPGQPGHRLLHPPLGVESNRGTLSRGQQRVSSRAWPRAGPACGSAARSGLRPAAFHPHAAGFFLYDASCACNARWRAAAPPV